MANTTLNFKPTRDWVVLPVKDTEKTEAGIIIPAHLQKELKTNILEVLAAGPQCQHVKTGDTVMVHPTAEGLIVEIDKERCVLVSEYMICGIIPSP